MRMDITALSVRRLRYYRGGQCVSKSELKQDQPTVAAEPFVERNANNPKSQLTTIVEIGTPTEFVRSSLRRKLCPQRGHASGMPARAWRILEAQYNVEMPELAAEKIKKPLKKMWPATELVLYRRKHED